MDVEENFPRGRGERTKRLHSPKSTSSVTKKRKVSHEEPDLFREKTFVPKVKEDLLFLPDVIATGMVVLGCVSEVRDFELFISLPNGMYGTVGIANICGSYTSALERMANNEDDEDGNIPSLDYLFFVGKLVRCKVTGIVLKDRKRILTLSLNPSEVNCEIKQLKQGMVLTGCIASCEDHGYVVDLGVKAVSAFLRKKDAEAYSSQLGERGRLFVGSYLHCVIGEMDQLGKNRVVNVFVDPQRVLASTVDLNAKIKMHHLLPGTVGFATIQKVSKDSVSVVFLSYPAIVYQFHLKSPMNKYQSEQEIKVTVLYIDPVSKTIVLSELPHLANPNHTQIELFGSIKVGDVVNDAVILWANPGRGIYLRLTDKQKAFASIQNVPDSFAKKVKTTFGKGTSHKCRVLRFNLVDLLAVVALKKSVIKQPFLSYADIQPATIVKCCVRNVLPIGVSVDVAHNIIGFIPRLHLSEMLLKHPERKFLPGKKLKCKVLCVDPSRNKLHLTMKKSLVESKSLAVTSYEQCAVGRVIEGCIADIKQSGAVVLFYNNVKGFVPRRELSEQELDFPEKLFYLGQTVKCRVLNCSVDEQKMTLSLRVGGNLPQSKGQVEVPADWSIGKVSVVVFDTNGSAPLIQPLWDDIWRAINILSCRVSNVGDAGLDVELYPGGSVKAFLPKVHLSDHRSNYDLLISSYHENDIIDRVMVLGFSGGILLTKKESLINYQQDGNVVTDFSALKLGMLAVGVLKRKMEYGVFIDLLHGLTGLAPKKYLLDNRHPDPASLLHEGQTLTAKVTEVDVTKNRFLVSIRSTDCFHGDSDVGIQLLSNYLGEYRDAIERLKSSESDLTELLSLNVGQVVKVKVTTVSDIGITCVLKGDIKGFATLEHMPGIVCKVGQRIDSVVLHVDPVANCVQLTLNKEVLKAVEHFKDNKFTQVREGQSLKAEVQLVTEDFVLVLLKAHASGRFAYLPAKRHLNDVTERHQFLVSQINNIIIKRIESGSIILANLVSNETIAARADASGKIMRQGEMPSIGAIETAYVRQVYDLQLNVSVNGFAGRVHITEVFDDCKQMIFLDSENNCIELLLLEGTINHGCKLSDKFQTGSELQVKIIGYRTLKANKYLPITQADRNQIILECSAKSSKLLSGDIEEDHTPKVGDKIAAYVSSYRNHLFVMQISPKVQATMHLLNAADDIEVLKKAADIFKVGSGHLVKVIGQGKRLDVEVSIAERESELRPGLVVPARVLSVIKHRGIHVQLPCGQVGDAYLTDLSDEYIDQPESRFAADQFVECYILSEIEGSRRKWAVSLRQSRIRRSKSVNVVDEEITSFDELSQDQILCGYVVSKLTSSFLVSFAPKVVGQVRSSNSEIVKIELGKVVTTKITALYSNTGNIDLTLVDQVNSEKRKVVKRDTATSDYDTGEEDANQNDNSCLSVPFTWDSSFSVPKSEECPNDSESDTDVKTSTQTPKTRAKRITGKEREKKLYEAELRLVQPDLEPQTKEEFERLVFQSPLSSMCWLRYAAMHIAETDIDSARNVFKRALQAIPASEEKERLNVWTAYLNTEFTYGSQSAADELITWGMQHQDPVEIQRRVISIYERAGKIDMAEDIYKKMLISNKSDATVWIGYTSFLYANGRMEAGRKLLGRAMLSVDKTKHVDMTCKVAQLEFRHGNVERGKSLFEEIITNLPRRTDVWSIYIDACIKHGDISHARTLFDRVSSLKLHPKPMALFMRRFLDFEQKFGTEQSVEAVKRKAVTYCEQN